MGGAGGDGSGVHPVGFEVQNGQAVGLHGKAVHHALEHHLFPGHVPAQPGGVGEEGELELPADLLLPQQPLAQGRGEEGQHLVGADGVGLAGGEKFLPQQPVPLRFDCLGRGAGFVPGELHKEMGRHAPLGGGHGPGQKAGAAEGAGRQRLDGPGGGLFVGNPALELGGRELGGDGGGSRVGIDVVQQRQRRRVRLGRRQVPETARPGCFIGIGQIHGLDAPGVRPDPGDGAGPRPGEEGPGFGAGQGGQQHPVPRGSGRGAELVGQGQRQLGAEVFQLPVQIAAVIGHHQPILGPGHGHVENPQLLGNGLLGFLAGDGGFGQGGVADHALVVHPVAAQAQIAVGQNGLPQILEVELPREVAEEHHRELQPLGGVDRHKGDGVAGGVLGPGQLAAAGLEIPQMPQQLGQRLGAGGFKGGGEPGEGPEIPGAAQTVGHGGENVEHPGPAEDALQQFSEVHPLGVLPQGGEGFQEGGKGLRLPADGVVEVRGPVPGPGLGQLIGADAEEGTQKHRGQRHVLVGIVQHLEQRYQQLHLRRVQQAAAPVTDRRDALAAQLLQIDLGRAREGPHQNGRVAGLHGPKAVSVGNGLAPVQHLPQTAGRVAGLGPDLVGGLLAGVGQTVELHRLLQGGEGPAGPQGLPFGVVQVAHGLAHDQGEDLVAGGQNLGPGPEVLREQNLPGLAPFGLGRVGIRLVFRQKQRRIGQPEAVDGLLHVAHHKAVAARPGDGLEDGLLDGVGVLVLVHQNFVEPGADLPGHGGGLMGVAVGQQADGLVLQVGEVQHPAAALFGGVGLFHLDGEGQQSLESRGCLGQVGQHLPGRGEEPVLPGLQLRPGRRADLGQPVLDRRVLGLADGPGPAKAGDFLLDQLVPGLECSQLCQLPEIFLEDRPQTLPDLGIGLHLPEGVGQLLLLPPEKGPELV